MSVNYKELKKNGFMLQRQPDYFSVRLKSVGGHFTAEQLDTIQKAARIFGKGYIHLTSRQGIEIPFVHLDNIEALKNNLRDGGVQVGVSGPRVRTITACQGNAVCASGWIDTFKLATEFDKRYGGRDLPHKFKFGFTGCHNNCLKTEENDIGVKGGVKPSWNAEACTFCGRCQAICPQKIIVVDKSARNITVDENRCVYCGRCVRNCPINAWRGESGFVISFGGLYGNRIAVGKNFLPIIFDEEKLYQIVDAALKFFADNAKSGERFRNMLDRVGWEEFIDKIQAAAK